MRIAKLLVPGLLAAVALVAPAQAEIKVGVVDFGRLLQESPQAKVAFDALQAEFAPREADINRLNGTLKGKQDRLQKDGATMSEAQRSAAEKELRDGARDLQRKQQEVQDDFNARRNEEMSKLQRTLLEEVNAYSKAQGFDLVLAEGYVFASPTLDITGPVLAALQARRPAAAAAKPAAK